MTTKGLRYLQIRKNTVRECVQSGLISVKHVGGKTNPLDIFTKEDKDILHFEQCRDALCSEPPSSATITDSNVQNANLSQQPKKTYVQALLNSNFSKSNHTFVSPKSKFVPNEPTFLELRSKGGGVGPSVTPPSDPVIAGIK